MCDQWMQACILYICACMWIKSLRLSRYSLLIETVRKSTRWEKTWREGSENTVRKKFKCASNFTITKNSQYSMQMMGIGHLRVNIRNQWVNDKMPMPVCMWLYCVVCSTVAWHTYFYFKRDIWFALKLMAKVRNWNHNYCVHVSRNILLGVFFVYPIKS